jgi:hypothetical protein
MQLSRCSGWLSIGLAIVAACHRPPPQGRVFGTVTTAGVPLPAGVVVFHNDDRGVHIQAPIGADGSYELHTARGAGLPLGEYRVSVNQPMGQPAMPGGPKPPPIPNIRLPAKYTRVETSGLAITVTEGDNRFDIALE